jgi:hypothetical protein
MRPSQYAARSDPGVIHKRFSRVEVDKGKLTRFPVGVCVVVISRFANIAVPISSPAMRADADALLQRQLQAPVGWKFHVNNFFDLLIDSIYAIDLLCSRHDWPLVVQLNAAGVFHNDVFAANGVQIIAPVKDLRYRYTGICLHYDA